MKFFQMLMGHSYYPGPPQTMGPYTGPGSMNTSALPYGTGMPYNLENEN